ncbi:MAG TPA: cobalt ECF transporter T component CbiQ [Synergistaceae bacterium]|jgi:cobalt/nickel transport system permease protein|nr:MAG: Cobalt ABC transporter, inner membrane subunit CbiQ [Synergistales bacterium 54_9]MDK2846267.1 cobalt/nickel transport system permease protein [Synergistales bacterium]MDN5335167.1 cobalt/nickel transport system permease protein [Synergistales bacterium]HAA47826.1 cobalt ECF transporter T component CbiQ [Synergistaceae bacterium]
MAEIPNAGRSLLHRTDARIKVAFAAIFALSVAIAGEWGTLTALLGLSLFLAFFGGISPLSLLKRLAALDGILLLLWVTLPLSGVDKSVFIGPLALSKEGLVLAFTITLRSHAAVIGFLALLGTSKPHEIMRALRCFRLPEKLVLIFHFTYRYSHVLFEEAARINEAMVLRGFTPGLNLHSLKSYGNLMGCLFLKSFQRAERVTEAMELRGFSATFPTLETTKSIKPVQIAALSVFFALVAGCFLV